MGALLGEIRCAEDFNDVELEKHALPVPGLAESNFYTRAVEKIIIDESAWA